MSYEKDPQDEETQETQPQPQAQQKFRKRVTGITVSLSKNQLMYGGIAVFILLMVVYFWAKSGDDPPEVAAESVATEEVVVADAPVETLTIIPTPTPINVDLIIAAVLAAQVGQESAGGAGPTETVQVGQESAAPLTPGPTLPPFDEATAGDIPTPDPTATPDPILETPEPCPEGETPDYSVGTLLCLQPVPTKTPEATVGPTPVPTPRVRSVNAPDLSVLGVEEGGATVLNISGSPQMINYRLSMSGTITDRPDISPSMVQVWQAKYAEGDASCSTERPVAFLRPGNTESVFTQQTSPYEWQFCRKNPNLDYESRSAAQVDDVPWLFTTTWEYTERHRRYTTEPRIWDWTMTANLDHALVKELEYSSGPSYWRIIVFSGTNVIAYEIANR